jgi:hypothetical protein
MHKVCEHFLETFGTYAINVKMAYRCLKYKELMALANKTTNGYAKNML